MPSLLLYIDDNETHLNNQKVDSKSVVNSGREIIRNVEINHDGHRDINFHEDHFLDDHHRRQSHHHHHNNPPTVPFPFPFSGLPTPLPASTILLPTDIFPSIYKYKVEQKIRN